MRNELKENKIKENFYKKGDNTYVYFFSKEFLENLFETLNLKMIDFHYCTISQKNRKTKIELTRVYVNAQFIKK